MLLRLSKTERLKAGWCIALAYLFCVLAPSLAFAFADGSRPAPCMMEDHIPGMHLYEAVGGHHFHVDLHSHDPSLHPSSITGGETAAHKDASSPMKAPHGTTDARCCGLVSLSALPAGEINLAKPAEPTSRCESECTRAVADNAPARLYRPPIS